MENRGEDQAKRRAGKPTHKGDELLKVIATSNGDTSGEADQEESEEVLLPLAGGGDWAVLEEKLGEDLDCREDDQGVGEEDGEGVEGQHDFHEDVVVVEVEGDGACEEKKREKEEV